MIVPARGIVTRIPVRAGGRVVLMPRRRGMGQSYSPATNVQQAAAQIATGEGIGSAIYQENLAAAKSTPDFNQAQFDAWWNCQTQGGFGAAEEGRCPEPTFVAYAGTAVENRPAVLPVNVVPSVTPIKTTTTTTTKAKTAPPPPAGQTQNQPVGQSNAPNATTVTSPAGTSPAGASNQPGTTTVLPSTWMSQTTYGIPTWILLAGAAGVGLMFFMGGKHR